MKYIVIALILLIYCVSWAIMYKVEKRAGHSAYNSTARYTIYAPANRFGAARSGSGATNSRPWESYIHIPLHLIWLLSVFDKQSVRSGYVE